MTDDPWMVAGGPAFPSTAGADHETRFYRGMTARDYFAGQALIGLLGGKFPGEIARIAYGYADAMLKERAK